MGRHRQPALPIARGEVRSDVGVVYSIRHPDYWKDCTAYVFERMLAKKMRKGTRRYYPDLITLLREDAGYAIALADQLDAWTDDIRSQDDETDKEALAKIISFVGLVSPVGEGHEYRESDRDPRRVDEHHQLDRRRRARYMAVARLEELRRTAREGETSEQRTAAAGQLRQRLLALVPDTRGRPRAMSDDEVMVTFCREVFRSDAIFRFIESCGRGLPDHFPMLWDSYNLEEVVTATGISKVGLLRHYGLSEHGRKCTAHPPPAKEIAGIVTATRHKITASSVANIVAAW